MSVDSRKSYVRALNKIEGWRRMRALSLLRGMEGHATAAARDANRRRRSRLDSLIDGYTKRCDAFLLGDHWNWDEGAA